MYEHFVKAIRVKIDSWLIDIIPTMLSSMNHIMCIFEFVKWYEKYFCIWETWSEKSRWPKRGMVKIELCPGQAPSLMSQKLFPLPPREHPPHKTPFPVPEFPFPPHVPAVYGQALLRANRCFWRLRTLRTMTFPMTNSQYLDDQEGGQTESCIGRGCVRRLSPEHSTNPPWPPLRSDKYEWSPTSGHSAGNLPSSYIYIIPYLMTNTYYPWTSYFWFSWQWEIPNRWHPKIRRVLYRNPKICHS